MLLKRLLVSVISIPVVAQVSPVASSEFKDSIPAFGLSRSISLPAACLKVDIDYPRGKKERVDLTVIYDPASGYYLWNTTMSDPNRPDDARVRLNLMKAQATVQFVDTTGLVQFDFGDGLGVKTWQRRASSLDAAVAASTNEIRQGLATFEGLGFHRDFKFIPVFGRIRGFDAKIPAGYKPIPTEFRCEPFNAFCPSDNNRIASVTKEGSNWKLVLRNRFDVEVILDQDFDLVSARQLTQPK